MLRIREVLRLHSFKTNHKPRTFVFDQPGSTPVMHPSTLFVQFLRMDSRSRLGFCLSQRGGSTHPWGLNVASSRAVY